MTANYFNRRFARTFKFLYFCSISLFLTACTSSPITPPPAEEGLFKDVPAQWKTTQSLSSSSVQHTAFSDSLLKLVNQPLLNKLVHSALTNNIDLQKKTILVQIKQAETNYLGKTSAVSADTSLSSQNNKGQEGRHNLTFNLSWEVDLWRRLADKEEASKANALAQMNDLTAARSSLTARIIQQWLSLQNQRQILSVEQQQLARLQHTQKIIRQRYRTGLGLLYDLQVARSSTANLQSKIIARQQQLLILKQQLNLLLGRAPSSTIINIKAPLEIANPNLNSPLSVMQQRPDIKAALQRIYAAEKNQSLAKKALLPSFKLSASLSQTSSLSQLLQQSSSWGLLSSITAPLFQGGRLRKNIEISQYNLALSYLDLRKKLLVAITEVEAALSKEQALSEQQRWNKQALKATKQNTVEYQRRYSDGLIDVLTLLSAEQQYLNNQIQLLEMRTSRLKNRINLALALGVGI